MTDDTAPTARETYWRQGAALVEDCLARAVRGDAGDVPMPLTGADAALWHRAQVEAYRHALEMMAPPAPGTTDATLARTNEATARLIAGGTDARGHGAAGRLVGVDGDGREIRSHVSRGGAWEDAIRP